MNPFLLLLLALGGMMGAGGMSSGTSTQAAQSNDDDQNDGGQDDGNQNDDDQDDDGQDDGNQIDDDQDDDDDQTDGGQDGGDQTDDDDQNDGSQTGEPISVDLTFAIFDNSNFSVVQTISPGETIDFGTKNTEDYLVAVIVSDNSEVGSVVIEHDGDIALQNRAPYKFKFDPIDLSAGDFTVSATAYSGSNGTGDVIGEGSISFSTTSLEPADDGDMDMGDDDGDMGMGGDDDGNDDMDHGDHGDGGMDMGDDDDDDDDDDMDHGDHGDGGMDMGDDDDDDDDDMDHGDHGDGGMDMGDDDDDDDDDMDHGDHGDGGMDMGDDDDDDDDDMDHGGHGDESCDDDQPAGPCPKTGDAVCNCNKDDDTDHGDHHVGGHGTPTIAPPGPNASASEINAYVAAVKASPEDHGHHGGHAGKHAEHMASMDLVDRSEATHVAVKDGDWFDPDTWHKGNIPDDDAKVLIPEGITVEYGDVSDERLFTVRIDGKLDFATDEDSQMIFDTMIVSPTGALVMGTVSDPVDADVNIDLIVANNGKIDTNWDEMLLSRGIVSHGAVSIHGAEKDSHEKVTDDPMKGDTSIKFDGVPEGWAVGDTIIIAGTRYDGYKWDNDIDGKRLYPNEDEVRVITEISNDGTISFDDPLDYDHDVPRDDLKTSVANYTRNVSVESEDGADSEVWERGHVMFMHSDEVDVRYAEFHELGRTDKSETSVDIGDVNNPKFDTNVQGRYSVHLHRTGVDDYENPTLLIGNSVYGSPGWGFVHHDSNAILDNNATFDTFGAGYVAETGNETGAWNDNIAIYAEGIKWAIPKNTSDISKDEFDTARGGDGFWFQGRLVAATNNVAASVNTGYAYFHRDGDDRMEKFDSELFEYGEALHFDDSVGSDDASIRNFDGNEAFAANEGLHVVKANTAQGHDVWSHLTDFTAWSVVTGAHLQYTSHYILEDFDLIGKEPTQFSPANVGIKFGGKNVTEMVVIDPVIEGFPTGINLHKALSNNKFGPDDHDYVVINPTFKDVDKDFANYNPNLDRILSWDDVNENADPDLDIKGTLRFDGDDVRIDGTKTDSLGKTDFPGGMDDFDLKPWDVINILETTGYWTTQDGDDYTLLELFFTERSTGDIYSEHHTLYIADNIPLGSSSGAGGRYEDAMFNGVQNITTQNGVEKAGDIVLDEASLAPPQTQQYGQDNDIWEALTQGFGVFSEDNSHDDDDDDMDHMDHAA